jgi:hypothetical protein
MESTSKRKPVSKVLYGALIVLVVAAVVTFVSSPKAALITTGQYGQSTESNNAIVDRVLGDNAEEKFALYFQWYNVIHELGHAVFQTNNGPYQRPAYEEQLVNDFAVAFWSYYGDPNMLDELASIVDTALSNLDDPSNGHETHIEYALRRWGNDEFYSFEKYGWFQFSCVRASLQTPKTLAAVLVEMGVKDIRVQPRELLSFPEIGEETTTLIIGTAVTVLREWGAKLPTIYHTFSSDPNANFIQSKRNIFGYLDVLYTRID